MGDDAIREAAAKAELSPPATGDEQEFIRLATLPSLDYERVREAEAKRLKMRVSVLDREVDKQRPPPPEPTKKSGQALVVVDDELWQEKVDGAQLLDDYADLFQRHVILPKGAAETLALWTVNTFCFERFDIFPRLTVTSPAPRCGKTTLLDMLRMCTARAINTSSVTAAAMFRLIDAHKPTLLVDECDTFLPRNEDLRGIINNGHARSGIVVRTVGDDHEARAFSCYAPVVLAGIGKMPNTIEERAIQLRLIRAMPNDHPARIDRITRQRAEKLRRKAARWTHDNSVALANIDPAMPDYMNHREADNWRPLFALALLVRDEYWIKMVKWCARHLIADANNDDALQLLALTHIRDFFETEKLDRARTSSVVASLIDRDDAPWSAIPPKDHELTTQRLSKLIGTFDIKVRSPRDTDGVKRKFYYLADFKDAFTRYLS
jgi:putative DNA primase/helicase